MTDALRAAFRERMASAIRFFAAVPDDSAARRELASLLAYGPGAIALFEQVVAELVGDGTVSRSALATLKAFAIHVQRTTSQGAVSPAWLEMAPKDAGVDETVLRDSEDDAPPEPPGSASPAAQPPIAAPPLAGPSAAPVSHDGDGDDELPAGTVCAERYVVEEPIAIGGMSTVYSATDRRDGRRVALKVLRRSLTDDLEMVEAFAREADNAWSLRHPGFVKVLAQGWVGTQPFLALEYLEGQSLGAAMRGKFATGAAWPAARRILTRIGAAIAHAHAHGLVHADLKPGNIFLLHNDEPRVLDLGAAQVLHGDARLDLDRDRDLSGAALTPTYASPEMLLGASAEPRDDIFSLAVIGYELVTGRHPFDRHTADRARHLDIQPKRPPGIPAGAWRTLRKGLALRRDRRPASMAAFAAGLKPALPAWTIVGGGLVLASLAAATAWSHYYPEDARQRWETGRTAVGLATDLLGLRPLAERPEESLVLADRLADGTGWTAPRDALIDRLAARLAPEVIATDTDSQDRAVGALLTLRRIAIPEDQLAGSVLTVTRTILGRTADLIHRGQPLPVDAIAHQLEQLRAVDPDGLRVVATHLTDLLNERRRALQSDAERAEFDRLAAELVQRFPILPPPFGEAMHPHF